MLKKRNSLQAERQAIDHYVWNVESKPVSVHLNLGVAGRLQKLAQEAAAEGSRRGVEVGGVLLGRISHPNEDHYIVSIEQMEPVEIEHIRGASFILSTTDKHNLFSRIRRLERQKDELEVVGFFRSHTRPGLYLDEYDFELMQCLFAHPASIALLLRPAPDGPATAGFFIWEDGDIQRACSYRTFPLPQAIPAPRAPEVPEPVAAEPAPALKAEPVTAAVPAQAEPAPSRRVRRPWLPVAVAAAAILAVALAQQAGLFRSAAPSRTEALALNVEPMRNAMRLTWDAKSPVLAKASSGKLSISDGELRKEIALDKAQLASGSLVYMPSTPDVSFHMHVGPFVESLRAVAPSLPLAPAEGATPAEAEQPAQSRGRTSERRPAIPPAAQPKFAIEKPREEVRRESRFKKAVGMIPALFRGRKNKQTTEEARFIPAKAVRQVQPALPRSVQLERDAAVAVRVSVDNTGRVKGTDLVTRRVDSRLAEAALDAARRWRFEPAREHDRRVESSVVLHFKFPGNGSGS